jgi:hypothetical protein
MFHPAGGFAQDFPGGMVCFDDPHVLVRYQYGKFEAVEKVAQADGGVPQRLSQAVFTDAVRNSCVTKGVIYQLLLAPRTDKFHRVTSRHANGKLAEIERWGFILVSSDVG